MRHCIPMLITCVSVAACGGTIVSMTRGAGARSGGAPARLGTLAGAIATLRK